MKSFSVATFNVHSWCDANFSSNYDRVKELIKVSTCELDLHNYKIAFLVSKQLVSSIYISFLSKGKNVYV